MGIKGSLRLCAQASFRVALLLWSGVAAILCGCASTQAIVPRQSQAETVHQTAACPREGETLHLLCRLANQLPRTDSAPALDSLSVIATATPPMVSDGYSWSLWRDPQGQVWLALQGGFVGSWQWFGPADQENKLIRRLMTTLRTNGVPGETRAVCCGTLHVAR